MIDNSLVAAKWVRIMLDWCSSGIWDIDGGNCDEADLPVTPELIERIKVWQAKFERQDPMGRYDVDLQDWLALENLLIAIEVAKQLPDWTVVIYNGGEYDLPEDEYNNSIVTSDMVVDENNFPLNFKQEF